VNGVAIEHMVVQVRTIARRIFDASQDKQRVTTVDRAIAHALSATSVAITEKIELIKRTENDHVADEIAKDLQAVADNLTEELILRNQQIPRDQFVRCMSLVSAISIIAASLDETSPALLNVKTPVDPSSQPIVGYAPITKTTKFSKRVLIAIRKFLRR
jgi:predicted transcriptional regulator of viral defense system